MLREARIKRTAALEQLRSSLLDLTARNKLLIYIPRILAVTEMKESQ